MPIIDDKYYEDKICCSICNKLIIASSSKIIPIYNLNAHICDLCHKKFDEEDLELVINLLMIYGGYFGQFNKNNDFNIAKLLKAITEDLKDKSELIDPPKLNVILMHRALLHGITPKEYLILLNEQFEFR